MRAFNEKSASFEHYDEPLTLVAHMLCNGCDKELTKDLDMQKKIKQVADMGTDAVHVGVCVNDKQGEECETIHNILSMFEDRKIEVVRGTH
jgi:predicted metal-binding protein